MNATDTMGMTELSLEEMDKVSGGFWDWLVAAVIIFIGYSLEGRDASANASGPYGPEGGLTTTTSSS